MVKKLQRKFKQQQMENQDLTQENAGNKDELLGIIRFQEKELKFSDKVINILLSENEKYKIRSRAQWSDSLNDYQIPQFIFNSKSKEISFPTINAKARAE